MKKQLLIFLTICCFPFMLNAQMPERTPENIAKYKELCRAHIYKDMKGMYREAGGALVFPFLAPGSNQYLDMLWDWDSWLSNIALRQILLENGTEKDKQEALKYEQGCILNSLHYGGMDGWIPIWIERNAPSREEMLKTRNPWKSNMHKPTLAQHAAFIVRNMNGDAEWLRDDFYTLQASGITVIPVDLSEILAAAHKIEDTDEVLQAKLKEIRQYAVVPEQYSDKLVLQAKFGVAVEKWMEANEIDAVAIQCWDSLEQNYGCAACVTMSMLSEKLIPAACEVDIAGAVSMYALTLASGRPSALLDWNNNFAEDRNKCVCTHCGNFLNLSS